MKVRCGRCREPFEVAGTGQHACPMCGSINAVGSQPAQQPEVIKIPSDDESQTVQSAGPTRIECPMCDFSFYVGDVAVAPCPNCRHDVVLRSEAEEADHDV